MRFSTAAAALVAVNALGATAVPTAVANVITTDGKGLNARDSIERRLDPITLAIVTGVVSAAAGWVTTEGLGKIKAKINSASDNWEAKREAFTQATTSEMWSSNPDASKWKAAFCYNKGYTVSDTKKMSSSGQDADIGKAADVNLKSGALSTDYDCFYIQGGTTVKVNGDGGFINLSMTFDNANCSYDKSKGLLSCK